jgi:hexosaminidase
LTSLDEVTTAGTVAGRAIVPAPLRCRAGEGYCTLRDGFSIECPPELAGAARWWRRVVEAATGWDIEIVSSPVGDGQGSRVRPGANPGVRLETASAGQPAGVELPSVGEEAYSIAVSGSGISVRGGSPAGVFYGLVTLLQLMPDWIWRAAPLATRVDAIAVPQVEIDDEPGYRWRGVHLDVSRHFMPKSFVLRLIDLLAMHKCNVLHLHLTDDQGWRMEIERYPRLTEVGAWRRESHVGRFDDSKPDGKPHGGLFTKEDLREIVAYAAERFVAVLPEIDMPGHMVAAIAAYPELGNTGEAHEVLTKWGISEHVLNLDRPAVEFCCDVLDEVVEVFPFRYVHAGGDECPAGEWEASPAAKAKMRELGYSEARQLQGWFTAGIGEHLAARGRVLVGWDEILDGGAPPGSVVMSWQGEEGGVKAAAAGHDVVMAPVQWLYLDWSYVDSPAEPVAIFPATSVERVYKYDPRHSVAEGDRGRVLGAQCQLWTEYVADAGHAEYMYFPRVCAFSEIVWSGDRAVPREPYTAFEKRLAAHLNRLDAIGVNYRPLSGPTPGQARIWLAPG